MEKVGRSVCCSLLPFSPVVILRLSVDLVHYKMSTLKKNTGKIKTSNLYGSQKYI